MRMHETTIPGVAVIDLDVIEDERGSFREVWQEEKAEELGLSPIAVKQCNVAESRRGATRGIHIEPWDKYVHVARGVAFASVVDARPGATHGVVETFELDRTKALFVPQGCGNAYQALTDDVVYFYLVTDVWRPDIAYSAIALDDPTLNIQWPLPRDEWVVSEKDANNPLFNG